MIYFLTYPLVTLHNLVVSVMHLYFGQRALEVLTPGAATRESHEISGMYQLFWSFDNHDLFQGDIRQLIWAQSQTPWWKKSRKSSWCVPIKGKHRPATTLRNNPWVESAPLRLLPKTQSLAFETCWLTGFNHLFIFYVTLSLCHRSEASALTYTLRRRIVHVQLTRSISTHLQDSSKHTGCPRITPQLKTLWCCSNIYICVYSTLCAFFPFLHVMLLDYWDCSTTNIDLQSCLCWGLPSICCPLGSYRQIML